jgi:muramoyltetrapeptide carboxypeptidase
MNRKHFIGGLGAVATGLLLPSIKNSIQQTGTSTFSKPPYLNAGDVIGITAPAGFITLAEVQPAIQVLESWGYKV